MKLANVILVTVTLLLFYRCEHLDLPELTIPDHCLCEESIVDERDGQEYKTVWIAKDGGNDPNKNGQCWMAENLNYGTMKLSSDNTITNNSKYCYDDLKNLCDKSGGLYNDNFIDNAIGGICPRGWRIPTDNDWTVLELYLGMPIEEATDTIERGKNVFLADKLIKALDILYTGYSSGYDTTIFRYQHIQTLFWTSTSHLKSAEDKYIRSVFNNTQDVKRLKSRIDQGYCIRCIKN